MCNLSDTRTPVLGAQCWDVHDVHRLSIVLHHCDNRVTKCIVLLPGCALPSRNWLLPNHLSFLGTAQALIREATKLLESTRRFRSSVSSIGPDIPLLIEQHEFEETIQSSNNPNLQSQQQLTVPNATDRLSQTAHWLSLASGPISAVANRDRTGSLLGSFPLFQFNMVCSW